MRHHYPGITQSHGKDSKEVTFIAITPEFKLDEEIRTLLLEVPTEDLQGFCLYFTDEKEIDAFASTDGTMGDQEDQYEARDDLVEEVTLMETKGQSCKGYITKHQADTTPSDQLRTRWYREISSRLLSVCDEWEANPQRHQVRSIIKRGKVDSDPYTAKNEAEETSRTYDAGSYLAMLHTHLWALSTAGPNEVHVLQAEEAVGSYLTKCAEIPRDVMQSYHAQAAHSAMIVLEPARLTWLRGNDITKRAVWVSQIRKGNEPLGQVVQTIMEMREAHGDASIIVLPPQPPHPPLREPEPPQSTSSHQKETGTRRNPGQSEILPRSSTGAITGGTLVPLQSFSAQAGAQWRPIAGSSEDSLVSPRTVIARDKAEASIYELCSTFHGVGSHGMEDGELSYSSVLEDQGMPMDRKDRVIEQRADNTLKGNQDFAHRCTEFEEAHRIAGIRDIAKEAYRKVPQSPDVEVLRQLGTDDNGGTYSEGGLDHLRYLRYSRHIENGSLQGSEVADREAYTFAEAYLNMAKADKVGSIKAKIGRGNDQRKYVETKTRLGKMPPVSFLRQPGKGAEVEEEQTSKTRFIQPLAQLTLNGELGGDGNTSATDEGIMESLMQRATSVAKAAETPTLQRATITADETAKNRASREKPMGISSLEPLELEHFLHESQSQIQSGKAVSWPDENLQLSEPQDGVEKPCVRETSRIGMEGNPSPTTQPDMLQALEEKLIAAAEKDNPTWLAAIAIWLQAMGDLRLNQVTLKSVPVELSSNWLLFFCKQGKQQHDRSGFYWRMPRRTTNGYDWTERFLAGHEEQRKNRDGKHMMGTMFRTEGHQHLSQKATLPWAKDAVSGAIEDPEELTTYS